VPILMLTARAETDHSIEGLEAGVDDYLGKPFEPRELLLRVSAILRRRQPDEDDRGLLKFGPFTFDPDRGELKRHGEIIRLTDREREFLTVLPPIRMRLFRATNWPAKTAANVRLMCRSTVCAASSRSTRPILCCCKLSGGSATG
jgi:DNA-binding response OmpR family regulator